ncbi:von Willebrand factor A domain-containing protein 5A [Hypsibius exemplaris]|uniref:von Willebrand factor A domain-containing protein 5A n=1 Tax=Hypsibius exemplaris TaxID=2072580 RepID=A0A1W0X6M7_HYPEX|nr:von Willebrand factor A domain-containing protein 5A [Hypsibius exemplaris]
MVMNKTDGLCGLFVTETHATVPLTAVHYDVDITSFAARISINQTYKNAETNDLECVYGFPINDQAAIIGFTVTIEDRTLVSHFRKKDEAFQTYSAAIAQGYGAYLLDQSSWSDDTFVLSVGRLPPGKECIVSISYVLTLESVTETRMRLTIPMSLSPRYKPNSSTLSTGVVPPETYQSTVPYFATLSGTIQAISVISSVTSPTHPLAVTLLGPQTVSVAFGANQQLLDRDLVIEIEVKSNPEHHVEIERIGQDKYAAMYAFIPRATAEAKKFVNTELIFLVDCSGSMEGENKIQDATRAMQLFLRSIPEGCYFNFYRFGSTFESLFDLSQHYSADSFNKAKDYAEDTQANLGGTEILAPLQAIYATLPKAGFSRQLFILTDGQVSNTESVIELIRKNANNTRVFSFGLGQSPSRSLVNGIAMAGNGKAEFIKQGEVLEDKIGRNLNRALQPAVTDATVTWSGVKTVQSQPTALPPVFYGDRQLSFTVFELDPTVETSPKVVLRIGDLQTESVLGVKSVKITENPYVFKLAGRALIKELETSPASFGLAGSLQNRGSPTVKTQGTVGTTDGMTVGTPDGKTVGMTISLEEEITKISLEYGVMSKYVSLVAVETKNEQGRKQASTTMELREVPLQKVRPSKPLSGNGKKGGPSKILSRGKISEMFETNFVKKTGCLGADFVDGEAERPPQTPLNVLLDLQQWDGSWYFSAAVEAITKVSLAEAADAINKDLKVDDAVLATLLVMTYIAEKFPDQKNIWQAILNKAAFFLSKRSTEPAISAAEAALVALIKAK